ncbi:MAG TPA: hypothetical protein VK203_09935 [Nostocaceae cyanobacterium]|nr:hypothetical protein [Nostocaceae cyanobacterium]
MGLREIQQVLAQIYTNTELRKRFFANPQVVGLELGLSLDEVEYLTQLSQKDVNTFANSLKWKRLGEVREMLPRTAKVLGKDFNTLFWQYAETYLPTGIKKHRDDTIAFSNFILKTANLKLPWIKDLLIFEQTWLLSYTPARCLYIRWFRYSVHLQDIQPQITLAIWWRLSGASVLHHTTIFLPRF